MKMPTKVKIGPVHYKVIQEGGLMADGTSLDGLHQPSTGLLKLRAELPEGDYKKAVLLHEIFHAFGETTALRLPRQWQEPVCNAFAYALLALIRDNPTLIRYLEED